VVVTEAEVFGEPSDAARILPVKHAR